MSTRTIDGVFLSALALLLLVAAPAASDTNMPAPMRAASDLHPSAAAPATAGAQWVRGKVVETMDAGNYTYVLLDTGSGKKWAAGPKTAVRVGDEVAFPGDAMEMKNFESKSLGRTFESIAFVGTLVVGDAATAGRPGVDATNGSSAPRAEVPPHSDPHGAASGNVEPAIDVKNLARAKGGYTVGEIYDKKSELEAKEVSVRGKVVKYNGGVMGRNWIHLRDGSAGQSGANDLTVTTDAQAKVGDTLLVHGRVGVNRDFGFGYRYDVMLESATIDVEK